MVTVTIIYNGVEWVCGLLGKVGGAVMTVIDIVRDDGNLEPDPLEAARDETAGKSTLLRGNVVVLVSAESRLD
jgi:hypothetical protein